MKRASLTRRQRLGVIYVLGVACTAVVLVIVYAIITSATNSSDIRATQLEGTPLGKQLVKSSDRILDCTEPGNAEIPAGECYTRSQDRTAEVVAQVSAGNVLAVVCALDVPDGTPFEVALRQVSKCVAKELKTR